MKDILAEFTEIETKMNDFLRSTLKSLRLDIISNINSERSSSTDPYGIYTFQDAKHSFALVYGASLTHFYIYGGEENDTWQLFLSYHPDDRELKVRFSPFYLNHPSNNPSKNDKDKQKSISFSFDITDNDMIIEKIEELSSEIPKRVCSAKSA
ncbi:hypothetical protein MK079_03640 [Candidatus Gracilibacteria bacterium]|nr:hypothetical protein [Candidatus Gracilibacteria bacterium]